MGLRRPLTRRSVVAIPLALVGVLLLAMAASAAPPAVTPVPFSQAIPDRYIVVFHPNVPSPAAAAADLEQRLGLALSHVYQHAVKGFAGHVPRGRLVALRRDPRVASVEADQTVYAVAQTIPTGVRRVFAPGNPGLGIDGRDDYRVDVAVAVLDTGIAAHPDLNVVGRVNCTGGGVKASCASGGTDGNGHGTHVAGTIGAIDKSSGVVGVAPGARLWSVKVLNDQGSGQMSWIVAGIDWVTANATTGAAIGVANMSLGCECTSSALNTAIGNSVGKGVVYVVAAGNNAKDAATFSPANHPDVIAVSALADFNGLPGGGAAPTCRSDEDDTLANFSNFGSIVAIAAPGVCILSTWLNNGYASISGTSMASPHVAGAAALLVSSAKPRNRTEALWVRSRLRELGNVGWVDDSGDGVKEPLLDVSNTTAFAPKLVLGSTPPADEPPAVSTVAIDPTPSGSVSGTVVLSATVIDDGGVTEVEFLLDGTPLPGTPTNGGDSWSLSWDTTSASNGAHTVAARAKDTAGQQATGPALAVTIDNAGSGGGDTGPVTTSMGVAGITRTLAANNKHLDVIVTIRRDADASNVLENGDPAVAGASVAFTLKNGNSTWVFSGTTDSAGNFRGRVTNAPGGSYTATVTAVSAAGLTWKPDPLDTGNNPATFSK